MFGKLRSLSPIVVLIAYIYYNHFRSVPSPIVTLKDGKVQGIVSYSRQGREFYSYLGIPYAKKPIGDLRFEPPQPAEPWDGVLDASKHQSNCLQFEFFVLGIILGSEDCLYIQVYSSSISPEDSKKKLLPVMVYIHGGLFHVGGSDLIGAQHLIDESVVIVTLNYRLGALGFLNSGDGIIRGNMGLKDQNLGLAWVQANIKSFNGDPSKVTIFGESAGGGSVNLHMLSPMSKGLMHKAIFQSGSAINYWMIYRNVKEQSQRFAKKFNCPIDDTKAMALCLKKLDANLIVGAHVEMMGLFRPEITTFVPSIEAIKDENAFLTEEPLEILKSGRFTRIPVITGCTSSEGVLISAAIGANQTKLNEANDDWDAWAPNILHYNPNLKEITSKIRKFYFGDEKSPINDTKYIQNFTNLFSDRLFTIYASQSARLHSKFVPTHLYYYDYNGDFSIGAVMANTEGRFHFLINYSIFRLKRWFYESILGDPLPHLGSGHGEDSTLLFSGTWITNIFLTTKIKDVEISKDYTKLFADFSKDVKPLKFRNVEWPALTQDSVKYLRISNDPAVIEEPFKDRRIFWESLTIPPT